MTVPRQRREIIAAIQKTHKKEAYVPIRKVSLKQIPFNDTLKDDSNPRKQVIHQDYSAFLDLRTSDNFAEHHPSWI